MGVQCDDYNAVATLYLKSSVDAQDKPTAWLPFIPAMRNAIFAATGRKLRELSLTQTDLGKAVDPSSQE
jgi:hypothetical protein